MSAYVHPTALVEDGVSLGEETKIWDNVHLRHGARIGRSTIVGEKTYVAYDVVIGSFVKINASVYICAPATTLGRSRPLPVSELSLPVVGFTGSPLE